MPTQEHNTIKHFLTKRYAQKTAFLNHTIQITNINMGELSLIN